MADCSSATFDVPNAPNVVALFWEEGYGEIDRSDDGWILTYQLDDARGGGYDLAERLRADGIPYAWGWGNHYAYDAGRGVSIPGVAPAELLESTQGGLYVQIDDQTGEPMPHELATAKRYMRALELLPHALKSYAKCRDAKDRRDAEAEAT